MKTPRGSSEFSLAGLRWIDLPVDDRLVARLDKFGISTVDSTGLLAAYAIEADLTEALGQEAEKLLKDIKAWLESDAVFHPHETALDFEAHRSDGYSYYQCIFEDGGGHLRFSLRLRCSEFEDVDNADDPPAVLLNGLVAGYATWPCEFATSFMGRSVLPYVIDTTRVEDTIGSLLPNEQNVLSLRYGLKDGQARTLEEVGRQRSVTRERIRQIEASALRRLRHSSRRSAWSTFLLAVQALSERLGLDTGTREFRAALVVAARSASLDLNGAVALARDIGLLRRGFRRSYTDFASRLDEISIAKLGRLQTDLQRVPLELIQLLLETEEARSVLDEWPWFSVYTRLKVLALQTDLGPRTKVRTIRLLAMERVLEEAGTPLHFVEIQGRLKGLLPAQAAMSARNVHAWLSRYHDRFAWTGQGTYGLRRWDVGRRIDESKAGLPRSLRATRRRGIAEEIVLILLETGAVMPLAEIEDRILSRFDVRQESVQAAIKQDSAKRFVLTRDGFVSLA